MRKTLIGFGVALVFVLGFLTGRWTAGGPNGGNPELPQTTGVSREKTLRDADREEARARAKYLIGMLASKNPAPEIQGERKSDPKTIEFSKEYDKSLQVPVYLAIQQLLAEDEGSIDLLLAHKDDNRYSYSVNADNDENVSVSRACEKIVRRKYLPFEVELHFLTRGGVCPYPNLEPFQWSWAKWWQKNKHRGLATLQIEAIDASIAFIRDFDSKTASPEHPAAQPLPIDEFNRRREENLKILKAIRQSILQTGEPYRAKSIDYPGWAYFFGLPWTRRKLNL